MLKKVVKVFGLFILMWFVSMMTMEHNFKYKNTWIMKTYFGESIKYRMKQTDSAFKAWRSVKPARQDLTHEDRMAAVHYSAYPPGDNGTPVILEDNLKHYIRLKVQKGWHDHAFNQFVSDLIPLNRTLPDVRHHWCKVQNYSKNLPTVSIIICFHNEAWSTLLRTLHSVLNRTPLNLINEIILFDDFSTLKHLKSNLEVYVRTMSKVVLARSKEREGLIRARLKAIKYATASVYVFLDSHCECNKGWLEPLLDGIAKDLTTVVSPAVDGIDDKTFKYIAQDVNNIRIGGFNWQLRFIWTHIPKQIRLKRPQNAAPIKTPTISGGIFAIHKDFFKKLGFYDEELDIWGGENLELSFKTWMCGGSLEIVPCSHVGHVFRYRMPYKGQEGDKGGLIRNLMRVAEVWMDDYKKYFVERVGNPRIYLKDVSNRKKLRADLKCKSFEWYLKQVYPYLEIPDNDAGSGKIYNIDYNLCLDLALDGAVLTTTVQLLRCHNNGGNQFWVYTRHGQIKRDEYCLEYIKNVLQMFLCSEKVDYQRWLYNNMTQHIKHIQTQKCLQITRLSSGYTLTMNNCGFPTIPGQKWTLEKFIFERLDPKLYTH